MMILVELKSWKARMDLGWDPRGDTFLSSGLTVACLDKKALSSIGFPLLICLCALSNLVITLVFLSKNHYADISKMHSLLNGVRFIVIYLSTGKMMAV